MSILFLFAAGTSDDSSSSESEGREKFTLVVLGFDSDEEVSDLKKCELERTGSAMEEVRTGCESIKFDGEMMAGNLKLEREAIERQFEKEVRRLKRGDLEGLVEDITVKSASRLKRRMVAIVRVTEE